MVNNNVNDNKEKKASLSGNDEVYLNSEKNIWNDKVCVFFFILLNFIFEKFRII